MELDSLRDPALVAREVASVLGVGECPGRGMERELPEALRDVRCLILLDNCEHLVGACAELADGLLRRRPGLAVLATSREPLGAAGEMVWPVPALSVPDSPSLAAASRCESVRLFAERAATASPDFELTETDAPAVSEVCRRLDGIPLAIELAAARVRTMTTAQISARLDDSLGLLASGPRTAPERQSTLRATIDWSHGLLDEAERKLFRDLSVFSGGFTLEAAEEVCWTVEGRVPLLDLLSRLVDKSLVQARRSGDDARYRLQVVIRQYASEKLEEAEEAGAMRRRHAIFFRDFVEEIKPRLVAGGGVELWLDLVDRELDNVRAALSWAAESGEGELGLRLANALAWFWMRQGRMTEGHASVERALEVGEEPRLDVAKAIHVSCGLAWAQGDREAAGPRLDEAAARFRELDGDASFFYEHFDAWFSSALSINSLEHLAHGETEGAVALAEEGIAVARRFEEGAELARGLAALGAAHTTSGNLAAIALFAGESGRAQSLAEESIRSLRGLDVKASFPRRARWHFLPRLTTLSPSVSLTLGKPIL